jgi:hypothetical protein
VGWGGVGWGGVGWGGVGWGGVGWGGVGWGGVGWGGGDGIWHGHQTQPSAGLWADTACTKNSRELHLAAVLGEMSGVAGVLASVRVGALRGQGRVELGGGGEYMRRHRVHFELLLHSEQHRYFGSCARESSGATAACDQTRAAGFQGQG